MSIEPHERLIKSPYERNYGAARRCEAALQHVCPDPARLDEAFYSEWGQHWDRQLGWLIDGGHKEEEALRIVVARCIDAYSESFLW